MGMYSSFIDQEISIKDILGLTMVSSNFEEGDQLFNGEHVDFSVWDGNKIEGYWYSETLDILKSIAPFIEGYAEFQYEEGYHFKIIFRGGRVYFQRSDITWKDETILIDKEEIK